MKVQTPVIWAHRTFGRASMKTCWSFCCASCPMDDCSPDLNRHLLRLNVRQRSRLLQSYQCVCSPGDCPRWCLLQATKKVQKAVTAVMMMPTSALSMSQYDSQTPSTLSPIRTPETQMIVTTIMTTVRQRDMARAAFCVHLIWTFQMRRTGM